uniref:Uncharacterized protein n=1 Tax=Populus alba TaxID=43335 RepID=A0A4U5PUL4_POPAL|nr:hypothetical protein D5086_0000186410 [Populus alba]
MGDKLHRREGNSPDHQLRPLNDRSVIKEVGVQRQPGGSSTEGESGPKIRPKGVVDGQQANIPVLPLLVRGTEEARRYGAEVTHAILPGKARTTFNKRVPVPETDTGVPPHKGGRSDQAGRLFTKNTGEPATEAPVNGGRNYNGPKVAKFLVGLGGRRRRPLRGGSEPSVRYHSGRARILTLCQDLRAKGQSQASQKVTEACKGFLGPDGDWPSSAKAEGSLTARPTRRAGTKVGLSDPTSSHRREGLAPRCRLFATWGCSMFQGLGCSPIKAVRELGSERRETVRSISGVGVRALRGPFPSTRGPGRTHLWCTSYCAHGKRWVAKASGSTAETATGSLPCGDGATEVLRIQEKVTARRAVYHYDRCQVEVQ